MRFFSIFLLATGLLASAGASHAQGRYVLQPGDTVNISVLQDPSLDRSIAIGPDGTISFPLAGHIRAGGLTAEALENALTQRLSTNYKGRLDVTVTLAQVNQGLQNNIFVTGEVNKPGSYPLSPGTNVMQAIALAGGLARFAAGGSIQVHRNVGGQEQIYDFDYDDYLSGRTQAGNIRLRPGDVVIVPERGLFRR